MPERISNGVLSVADSTLSAAVRHAREEILELRLEVADAVEERDREGEPVRSSSKSSRSRQAVRAATMLCASKRIRAACDWPAR
jgi:hypothetical protein